MDMDRNTQAVLRLLAEAQRLAAAATGPETAARMTIRTETGEYLGEMVLSVRAANSLADAVSAVAQYAESHPVDFIKGSRPRPADKPDGTSIDPLLEAELEEHCIGLDTDYLMTVASENPQQAVAEFDDITEDGGL